MKYAFRRVLANIRIIACVPALFLFGCAIQITVTDHFICVPDHYQTSKTISTVRRFALESGYQEQKADAHFHNLISLYVRESHSLFVHTRVIQVIQAPSELHIKAFDIGPEGPSAYDRKELLRLYDSLVSTHALSGVHLDQKEIRATMDSIRFAP